MIIVRKYNKNGSLEKIEFDSKLKAFLWINDNLHKDEWCWVMYEKDEDDV